MVDALSLGIAILAVIIAIIAIILAFVIPGATGPQGEQGVRGITGAPGGQNFIDFETVVTGCNLEFIPGMFYNISEATVSNLIGPSNCINAGDSITFSNNRPGSISYVKIGSENGGYCTWGTDNPLEEIALEGIITSTMVATGNTCDNGTGVEVYFYDN